MTFTVQMRKDVNPCHSRYHPQVKVTYTDHQAGDTCLDLVVVGLGGSRIVTQAPHRPGVVWKLSTYPQDPELVNSGFLEESWCDCTKDSADLNLGAGL